MSWTSFQGVSEAICGPRSPGSGKDSSPACAGSMTSFQMPAGRLPPVTRLVGELSSLPAHTPATSWAE
jgi:hypothetical protein